MPKKGSLGDDEKVKTVYGHKVDRLIRIEKNYFLNSQ